MKTTKHDCGGGNKNRYPKIKIKSSDANFNNAREERNILFIKIMIITFSTPLFITITLS